MSATRRQKVTELMESLQPLKRHMAFGAAKGAGKGAPSVTPSQWGVLMLIRERTVCTVKDIAAILGITSSAATQLVDGLVKSGCVVRTASKEDRRTVIISLSPKTKTHLGRMRKHALEKCIKIFAVLSDAEFDIYASLNKKIVASLKNH